jgi:membrane-associated phospholipid phosphatase
MWVFSLPNKARLKEIAIWGALATVAFPLIYGVCNYLASQQTDFYKAYFQWELAIPLVPWMIYPYMSLNVLFVEAAFILKEGAVKAYCLSLVASLFVAAFIFYFFPGELGFVRPDYVESYNDIFQGMYSIDKPHNLFPSLHVTYSSLSAMAMIQQTKSKVFHAFMSLWVIVIALSVVLVHQHHVIDIVLGFVLAIITYKQVYLKILA